MYHRIRDYIRESPVMSGGLSTFVVVGGLLLLFAVGLAAGEIWDSTGGNSRRTFDSPLGGQTQQSAVASGAVSAAGDVSAGGRAAGAEPSSRAKQADAGVGTSSVMKDAAAVMRDPEGAAPPLRSEKPSWLSRNFGPDVAPAKLRGLTRGTVKSTATTVTATYVGGSGATIESAQLTVAKGPKRRRKPIEILGEFGTSVIDYPWGDRDVTQGMTNETNLAQYPPTLGIVWQPDDFEVRLVAIPIEPGRVAAARAEALKCIAALPY